MAATEDLPETVHLNCPDCGWIVRDGPLMLVATEVINRRCAKCKTDWQIILRPIGRTPGGGVITQAEWTQ